MTKVKICGIQTPEDAYFTDQAAADFIGFVFADSSRAVTVEQAIKMRKQIKQAKVVGVFVNANKALIKSIYQAVELDYVQLHGDESKHYIQSLNLPTIKAVENTQIVKNLPTDFILVDSPRGEYYGGSGQSFDWSALDPSLKRHNLFLAGGLHSENVKEAIEIVQPYAVDVSSGVEINGIKNQDLIKKFIQKVKGD